MDAYHHEMQVRRTQLRTWVFARFRSNRAFCLAYNLHESEISALMRDKVFGSKRARKLESILGMPFRYLEGTEAPAPMTAAKAAEQARSEWPFKLCSYADFVALSPAKRDELDVRIAEFVAGATYKKKAKPSPEVGVFRHRIQP